MPKATSLPTTPEETEPTNFFFVQNPSPELQRVRDVIDAYREVEAADGRVPEGLSKAWRTTDNAMDEAINAFLSRTPRDVRDILEMLEVIARDNCWHSTHTDDVPTRFDLFVTALQAFEKCEGHKQTNLDCGARSFAIDIREQFPDVPEIKPGDGLVIDPDVIPSDDRVVFAARDSKALIVRYRDLPPSARLIGVAVEHFRAI